MISEESRATGVGQARQLAGLAQAEQKTLAAHQSQSPQPLQMGQSKRSDNFSAELHEVARLQDDWDKCRQGMARLDEYRDFIQQNVKALNHWQNSFSDPIEKIPGGKQLAEQTEVATRKTLAETDEFYAETRAKYLARQKEIEGQIDAAKKRLAAADGAHGANVAARGGSDRAFEPASAGQVAGSACSSASAAPSFASTNENDEHRAVGTGWGEAR